MLKVVKHERNTITYKCDCGSQGMCSVKPVSTDAALVVAVKCPVCQEMEMMTLLQYSSEENKEKLLKNLNSIDFSWSPTLNEEI